MALSRLCCCRTSSLFFTKSLAALPHWSPSSSLSPSQLRHAHGPGYYSSAATSPCRLFFSLRQLARELPSRGFAAGAGSPASSEQEKTRGEISTTASTQKPASEWNRSSRDLVAFSGGLGSAVWRATESVNRLLRSLSPRQLIRRVRDEDDNAYRLQLEVPGLSRDDLRVTVQGNYMVVTGEKTTKEEAAEESRDEEAGECWASSSRSYDYCNTWCMLPEDAKVDEIKAEVKHGMLYVTIPRAAEKKTDVVEVEVH